MPERPCTQRPDCKWPVLPPLVYFTSLHHNGICDSGDMSPVPKSRSTPGSGWLSLRLTKTPLQTSLCSQQNPIQRSGYAMMEHLGGLGTQLQEPKNSSRWQILLCHHTHVNLVIKLYREIYRSSTIQNAGDLDLELSGSFKVKSDVAIGLSISGVQWLIDWLYQSLTAHQHQKGHTVPKQVSPLDDDDDITESTRKKLWFYSLTLRTALSKNCTVWEHRYQAKSEQNVRQDLIPRARHGEAALMHPWCSMVSYGLIWFLYGIQAFKILVTLNMTFYDCSRSNLKVQ